MSVRTMQLPRMSDQTRALWEQLAGKVQGPTMQGVDFLGNLASGDPSQFEALEAPAYRQFNEQLGNIANRFSGAGSGARRSGAFNRAVGGEASAFAQDLQAQRMRLQSGALNQLMNLYGKLMTNDPYGQFHYQDEPKTSWATRLGGAAKGALSGASTGAGIGSLVPGVGTGIGAGVGALIGGIGGML